METKHKKYYSIGELIDENIKLKKDIERNEIISVRGIINILKMCEGKKGFDIDKAIRGYELHLEEIQNGNKA